MKKTIALIFMLSIIIKANSYYDWYKNLTGEDIKIWVDYPGLGCGGQRMVDLPKNKEKDLGERTCRPSYFFVYRNGDPNCCPSGRIDLEKYDWKALKGASFYITKNKDGAFNIEVRQ